MALCQVTIHASDHRHATGVYMQSVNELLKLFMRQAQLERAMKQRGGARIVEEQELHAVRQQLAAFPEAMKRDSMAHES